MSGPRVEVRERPILFSGEMVRAILDGRKTQARRVVRFRDVPEDHDCHTIWRAWNGKSHDWQDGDELIRCPYGEPGDRLWVRETWYCDHFLASDGPIPKDPPEGAIDLLYYRERDGRPDSSACDTGFALETMIVPWRPSIHMPRWASRLTLEVTAVRVERLQEISHRDAIAEGIERHDDDGATYYGPYGRGHANPVFEFRRLWDSLNGKRGYGWDANPWVWVIEFAALRSWDQQNGGKDG